jgi:hypothetical protein
VLVACLLELIFPQRNCAICVVPDETDPRPSLCLLSLPFFSIFTKANFSNNSHIATPGPFDHDPRPARFFRPTFPRPPPDGFPLSAPADRPSVDNGRQRDGDYSRLDAGRFSLSIRGVRKAVRKALGSEPGRGGHVEHVVAVVEDEVERWLRGVAITLAPDEPARSRCLPSPPSSSSVPPRHPRVLDSTLVSETGSGLDFEPAIVEVLRSPYNIVWQVTGSFTRFLIHCVARYYRVVSFSELLLFLCTGPS